LYFAGLYVCYARQKYEQEQMMAAIDGNERNASLVTAVSIQAENIPYFPLDVMCSYRRQEGELSSEVYRRVVK
jgi:hypothetical protein